MVVFWGVEWVNVPLPFAKPRKLRWASLGERLLSSQDASVVCPHHDDCGIPASALPLPRMARMLQTIRLPWHSKSINSNFLKQHRWSGGWIWELGVTLGWADACPKPGPRRVPIADLLLRTSRQPFTKPRSRRSSTARSKESQKRWKTIFMVRGNWLGPLAFWWFLESWSLQKVRCSTCQSAYEKLLPPFFCRGMWPGTICFSNTNFFSATTSKASSSSLDCMILTDVDLQPTRV